MQIPTGVEKEREKKQQGLPLKHNPVSALAVLYTWGETATNKQTCMGLQKPRRAYTVVQLHGYNSK